MNHHQQIEVLRILSSANPRPAMNENNNGTFINLTSLSSTLLSCLCSYVRYVDEQRDHLLITEKEMERLDNTYFKCNKETENTKIS
jgi:hypothetical protein